MNGTIYCIGGTFGQSGNKHCYKLVDGDSRWERIASLRVGRSQAGVAAFRGRVWVVGGCDAWNPLASVEIYDPAINKWIAGPPIKVPRRGCALVPTSSGLLYVIGGSDGTQTLATTEIYDPRMNLWTAGPPMTTGRVNVAAAVVDGAIFAVGGFSGKVFLNTIEYLDPERDEWTMSRRSSPTKVEAEVKRTKSFEVEAVKELSDKLDEAEIRQQPEIKIEASLNEAVEGQPQTEAAEAETTTEESRISRCGQ